MRKSVAEHKILFTGTMGAGKTTAIAAISEIPPISTDVRNSDTSVNKAFTTVGLDYGELTLDNGEKLRLYGTPGQVRYEFMWPILSKGALGLVILIDHSRPDPLSDLDIYLESFQDFISRSACVVGVGRLDENPALTLEDYSRRMARQGARFPVLPIDVRQREQVIQLLDLLVLQLETENE